MARTANRIGMATLAVILALVVAGGCLPVGRTSTTGPVASPSAGGPSATARPSPTPRAFLAAIDAFTARVTSGTLTYRVAFEGTARLSADLLPITGSMDVAGADFASTITYDFSEEYDDVGKIRVQVRAVRGTGYVKSGSGAWRTVKRFGTSQSYIPFKTVGAVDDLRYLGAVTVGGQELHRIGITGAVLIHPNTIPGRSRKEQVDDTLLEVVIDDSGRPRSGVWKLWGKSRVGEGAGQLQRVVYELDLTFTKVGSKLTVKKP